MVTLPTSTPTSSLTSSLTSTPTSTPTLSLTSTPTSTPTSTTVILPIFKTATTARKTSTSDPFRLATFIFGTATAIKANTPTQEFADLSLSVEVAARNGLNIRSAPFLQAPVIGTLAYQQRVRLIDLAVPRDGCSWMRLQDQSGWIATSCNGFSLIRLLF